MMLLIAALAGERLRRAWQDESIGEPLRRRLFGWTSKITENPDGTLNVSSMRRREWVAELVSCPYCLSTWLCIAMSVGWMIRPLRPIITGVAAAMLVAVYHDNGEKLGSHP